MKNIFTKIFIILSLSISILLAMDNSDPLRATFMMDKLDYKINDEKAMNWDAYGYMGYDTNKVYIFSEGELNQDESSLESENKLVISHGISSFWDIQAGIGYDKGDYYNQVWGVIGIQGLAPYFFETRVVILIDSNGNIGLKVDCEYEALITQKLILTPNIELSAYTKENISMEKGSGLSNIILGVDLRYELKREFAPYLGAQWEKNLGRTNYYATINRVSVVAGLRFWF